MLYAIVVLNVLWWPDEGLQDKALASQYDDIMSIARRT